jgi:hypothetical protein
LTLLGAIELSLSCRFCHLRCLGLDHGARVGPLKLLLPLKVLCLIKSMRRLVEGAHGRGFASIRWFQRLRQRILFLVLW